MLVFDFYLPARPYTYALFALSVVLAMGSARHAGTWWSCPRSGCSTVRGVYMVWLFASGVGSGLFFPLPFLPDWLVVTLWLGHAVPRAHAGAAGRAGRARRDRSRARAGRRPGRPGRAVLVGLGEWCSGARSGAGGPGWLTRACRERVRPYRRLLARAGAQPDPVPDVVRRSTSPARRCSPCSTSSRVSRDLQRERRASAGSAVREVLLMVGISALAFPLADLAVGNVERLRVYVRTGLFDAVLVRPLSALWQLVAMDFAPAGVGRVVQGIAVYVVALAVAPVRWSAARRALAVLAPLAGAVFFGGDLRGQRDRRLLVDRLRRDRQRLHLRRPGLHLVPDDRLRRAVPPAVRVRAGVRVRRLPAGARPARPAGPARRARLAALVLAADRAARRRIAALFWRTGVRHYRSTGS